jgi:hypothetical protein
MADFSISFEVKNEDDVQRFVNSVPEAFTNAIKSSLSDLRDKIENLTLTDVPVDTGALRDSIDISLSDDFTITAIAGEDYASYVDEGTVKMDAEPYFTDNITQAFDEFVDDLSDKIETSLQDT